MTDEERQRQIDFIINTLANITATQQQAELERKQAELERKQAGLERKADAMRLSRVEESMITLTQLSASLVQMTQRHDKRLDEHEAEIIDMKQLLEILTKIVSEGRNGQ